MRSLLDINDSVEMKRLLCNSMGRTLCRNLAIWTVVHVLLSDLGKVTSLKSVQDRNSHFLF